MNSSQYKSFKENISKEEQSVLRVRDRFIEYIRSRECNASGNHRQNFPMIVNEGTIDSTLSEEPTPNSSMTALFGDGQVFHSLGGVKKVDGCYTLFLTCKVANFKDCLIWYAARESGELQQLHMITGYKKTHTYKIVPKIDMDSRRISVKVEESTIYPLQTLNRYTLQYAINPDGTISYASDN